MNQLRAYSAPRIFDGENWHDNAALVVENNHVSALVSPAELAVNMPVTKLKTGFLAPGFVDLQVNGGGGVLLNNDPTLAGITKICAAHAAFGTTALLPTLITDRPEILHSALEAGIAAAKVKVPGFAGLHLEGPHLSKARKGAHDPDLIRPMARDDVNALVDAATQMPALITTVAPESVSPEQVKMLCEAGIKVSIGHSDSGAEKIGKLVAAGASMITHLFNAMSQFTGREPGMVGTALNEGALNVGLIADGYHVHPTSMALALRAKKGPGQIFLISDAMSTIGTDVTELTLNGRHVSRANGKLTLDDGTLAGADLVLAQAVAVMVNRVGVELGEALRMASLYPAQAAGLDGLGQLVPGSKADFIRLNDQLQAQKIPV